MRTALLVVLLLIFATGVMMVFSATSAEILDCGLQVSPYRASMRQMLFGLIALCAGYGAWRVGWKTFLEWTPLFVVLFAFLLLLVLIPGVGREVNGSKRWLSLGPLTFQPSEGLKLFLPAFAIYRFSQVQEMTRARFFRLAALLLLPLLLVLSEPDHGAVIVMGATLLILCFVMAIPWKWWAAPLAASLVVFGLFAAQMPYVAARMRVYFHPELDRLGKGHQPLQAKIAAGSGRLLGKGPGKSLQKLSYLPEAQNDYIAAIYAEEFGFFGILLLILGYLWVTFAGFAIAYRAPGTAAAFLAIALVFTVAIQAILNLGVVSGLFPSTGLNLPFFSQGGSSLVVNGILVGLLLSIPNRRDRCLL